MVMGELMELVSTFSQTSVALAGVLVVWSTVRVLRTLTAKADVKLQSDMLLYSSGLCVCMVIAFSSV